MDASGSWEEPELLIAKAPTPVKPDSLAKAQGGGWESLGKGGQPDPSGEMGHAKPVDVSDAKPADATISTKPIDATKPVDVSDATKPVDATISTKPVDVSDASKPVDVTKSVDATKPVDVSDATKPVDATISTKPVDVSDATKSVDATISTKPVDVSDASKPVDATISTKPVEVSDAKPVDTMKPEDGAKPVVVSDVKSANVTKPVDVSDATKPVDATKSVDATISTKPEDVSDVKPVYVITPVEATGVMKTVDTIMDAKQSATSNVTATVVATTCSKSVVDEDRTQRPIDATSAVQPAIVHRAEGVSCKSNTKKLVHIPVLEMAGQVVSTIISQVSDNIRLNHVEEQYSKMLDPGDSSVPLPLTDELAKSQHPNSSKVSEKEIIIDVATRKVVQSTIDTEMCMADDALMQMRKLRLGLDSRMRQLKELEAAADISYTNKLPVDPKALMKDIDAYLGENHALDQQNNIGVAKQKQAPDGFRPNVHWDKDWSRQEIAALPDRGMDTAKNRSLEMEDNGRWNPYHELIDGGVINVAQGIDSMLSSTMATLTARLPGDFANAPIIHPLPPKKKEVLPITASAILTALGHTAAHAPIRSKMNPDRELDPHDQLQIHLRKELDTIDHVLGADHDSDKLGLDYFIKQASYNDKLSLSYGREQYQDQSPSQPIYINMPDISRFGYNPNPHPSVPPHSPTIAGNSGNGISMDSGGAILQDSTSKISNRQVMPWETSLYKPCNPLKQTVEASAYRFSKVNRAEMNAENVEYANRDATIPVQPMRDSGVASSAFSLNTTSSYMPHVPSASATIKDREDYLVYMKRLRETVSHGTLIK